MKTTRKQGKRCAYWSADGCALQQIELADSDRLMTVDETAAYLRRTRKALENQRSKGDGPPYFRTKPLLYRLRDVDAWLAARRSVPQIRFVQRHDQLIPRLEISRKSSIPPAEVYLPSVPEVKR
jgi:hypothetical protein